MKTLIKFTLIATLLLTGSFLPVTQAQSSLDNCVEVRDAIRRDVQTLFDMTELWYAGEYNNAQDYWTLRDMRIRYELANCETGVHYIFAQYVAASQDIYIAMIIQNDPQMRISINRSADIVNDLDLLLD